MSDEGFVVWGDRYILGLNTIDSQHKQLLDLTNELYKACRQGDEVVDEAFRVVIHKLVDYVKFHLSGEEKMLLKINYPNYAAHKKEHDGFVIKVLEEVRNFESGKTFVPNNFVRFLRDWVLAHIAVSDKLYAEYIMKLKKEGKLTIEI